MEERVLNLKDQIGKKRRFRKYWKNIFTALAVVVVFCTTYALILPAISQERKAYCGQERHAHGEGCYVNELICGLSDEAPAENPDVEYHQHSEEECYTTTTNLICPLESSKGHTHTEECNKTEKICICGLEEDENHIHEDACYEEHTELICDLEETEGHTHEEPCYETVSNLTCEKEEILPPERHVHKEACYEKKMICEKKEHDHTLICYSNRNADLETKADWEAGLPKEEELTGIWAEDILAVAKSQLGYHESTENYQVVDEDKTKGYSRYGAWYGDAYGDWCAMFTSFCLHYAGIPENAICYEANCQNWVEKLTESGQYQLTGTYTPQPGDLIFFEVSKDNWANHVGIVKQITEDNKVETIEGNAGDCVKEKTYSLDDADILGYGVLPVNPGTENLNAQALSSQTITASIYTDETCQTVAEEDQTVITITGLLPEGATACAYAVELDTSVVDGKNVVLAYDITLYDAAGNMINTEESSNPVTVTIQPAEMSGEEEGVKPEDYNVYYIPEEGEPEEVETEGSEDAVSFKADHFSVYALTVGGTADTVYINGSTGKDTNNGTTANTAVQTFEKAFALVKPGGTIYVTGTVTIRDAQEWNLGTTAVTTIKRGTSFTGALITVAEGGSLELNNLSIHGGLENAPSADSIATNSTYGGSAKAPLIVVQAGANLTINDGAVLEYNSNVPDVRTSGYGNNATTTLVINGYVGMGGAVYSQGTVAMNGGTIRYCEAQCGGGIYVEGSTTQSKSTFYLNSGLIDSNYARDIIPYAQRKNNFHKVAGGGVYVGDYAAMTMSGGTVSNNQSSREGGGISLGWLNRSNNSYIESYITTFTMNGGTITYNYAVCTGGGLNITAGRQAFINAGDITYNTADGKEYQDTSKYITSGYYTTVFSGGGIYIDAQQWTTYPDGYKGVPGKAVINRAIITQNTARENGGGIAVCGTSENYVYGTATNGTAIYNNKKNNGYNTSANDVYVYSSSINLGTTVLGGGAAKWNNSSPYVNSLEDSDAAIKKAQDLATVYITNNSTDYLGGGIGCNGLIEIGGEQVASTYINIKKVWEDDGTIEHPKCIWVQVLQDGEPYGDPIPIFRTYDKDGNEVWPTYYVGGLPSGHTYSVQELEVPGYMATVDSVGKDFVITNKPTGFQVVKEWVGDTESDRPDSIQIQLYQNDSAYGDVVELTAATKWTYTWLNLPKADDAGNPYTYTAKEVEIPDGYYSNGDGVLTGEKLVITNTKIPETTISVEKRWADGVPGAESINVQLVDSAGKLYGDPVPLSSDNGWFHEWKNIPKLDSGGNEIEYSVKEINLPGYEAVITKGDKTTVPTQYKWETAKSLEEGNKYLLVASDGALGGKDSTGLQWIDVSENIMNGTNPVGDVIWTYDGSSLKNDSGKYLTTISSGDWKKYTYQFATGDSEHAIYFNNGKLYANEKKNFISSASPHYFVDISVDASEYDTAAKEFTLYVYKEGKESDRWGESHFIITNTKVEEQFELPETGSIGPTPFVIVGIILFLAVSIFLLYGDEIKNLRRNKLR